MANVRPATENDIDRILELYHELIITTPPSELRQNPSPDDYRRVFAEMQAQHGHELLVIEENGEVAGTMVLVIIPNLAHRTLPWALVEDVVIDHRYRGRGLGQQLMEYAITRAKELGCYRISLSSNKSRHDAHRFYRSLGFEAASEGFRLYF